MFFLLRAAFWLTVVFFALPPEDRPALASGATPATATMVAAQASHAIAEACLNRPESCADGAVIAAELGHRAARVMAALSSLAAQAGGLETTTVTQ
jgi:hypothetical protein